MARLTKEEVKQVKEYLESLPERVWIGSTGLTSTEVDLFDTIEILQDENTVLSEQNEIYKKFTTLLCNLLLENIDDEGICTMTVSKDDVVALLEEIDNSPKQLASLEGRKHLC